jgi:FkbM family methyltransferase
MSRNCRHISVTVHSRLLPVGELFERFIAGDELDVITSGDFYPAGASTTDRARPSASELTEWQALLDAVDAADGWLTMLELGAGFGRWTVYAAAAIRRYRPDLKYRLVAVEAEPTHFRWLKQHTRDNRVRRWSRAGSCRLVKAAASAHAGRDSFFFGNPDAWYGQALVRPENETADAPVTQVRTVTLSSLLKPLDHVDLIDLDIQGAELEVLAEAAPSLGHVRRIHVETHLDVIDEQLPTVLSQAAGDWVLETAVPLGAQRPTPLGDADFSGGGVQLWRNDALNDR